MITRNNLNVIAQDFLVFLSTLPNVDSYDYNSIAKSVVIYEGVNWSAADETLLDDWITANTIPENYIWLEVNNINIAIRMSLACLFIFRIFLISNVWNNCSVKLQTRCNA